MTDITLYTTGTITFTNGSATIAGVGTGFTGLLQGDLVLAPDGKWYEIADNPSPISATVATLDRVFAGTTVTNGVGGTDWVIFKASLGRDSVRTATKQLTDVSSIYRQIINLTGSDQTFRFSKATTGDRAGMTVQKAGVDMFQAGTFQDDDFSIRYLLASTWTKALGIDATTGGVKLYSELMFGNIISPATITGTTNDFAPAGIAQANILRMSSDAQHTLTGITGGADGRVLALFNVGAQEIDLEDQGGTSSAVNRFALGTNVTVPANSGCLLMYDGASSRWRLLAGSGSGTGGTPGTKGWSPILAYVSNGAGGQVAQIADWTGGEGAKPATGGYIGAAGLVSTAASAISVLGPAGAAVQLRENLSARTIEWTYVGSSAWQTLMSFDPLVGPPATLEWTFSSGTTDVDPGASAVSFNSATFGSITTLFFNKLERRGNDVSTWINTLDDSSSLSDRGVLSLIDSNSPSNFAIFMVTGAIVSSGNYFKVPVTPIAGAIPPNGDRLATLFMRSGDKGISGLIPRGDYSTLTSYLIGDVVDQNGSSYISLIQPNLNNAIAFEASNASWALFARGVNSAFVTAINLTLTNATTQATNSATSATASATSATAAAASATAAASSATAASGGATTATTQATAAATSATAANTSKINAGTSETNAASSATGAASSATGGASSATAAATSATGAATSATAAATSATGAAATLTNFKNLYLGSFASNPTVNNTGGVLVTGNLYFNSGGGGLNVYNGSIWVSYTPSSGATSVFGRTGVVVAAANDYTFAQIGSKPTTISGYGITDATIDNLSIHGADIASAATINLDTATGNYVHVTGSVGITAITLSDGRQRTVFFTGAPLITASGSLVLQNGAATLQTEIGAIAVFVADGTTVRLTDYVPASQAAAALINGTTSFAAAQFLTAVQKAQARTNIAAILRGHIAGLTLGWLSGTTFTITTGEAADSTNADLMVFNLGGTANKTTAAWSVGHNNGSFDGTGAAPSATAGWYHVFLIKRPDTGVVDVLTSLSATAPTLPTNYTLFRRIGSLKTNGSFQWIKFIQVGDEFIWDVFSPDVVGDTTLGTTSKLYTLGGVPPGLSVNAKFRLLYTNSATSAQILCWSSLQTSTQTLIANWTLNIGTGGIYISASLNIVTNTAQQIYLLSTQAANNNLLLSTDGWIDTRGRFA